MTVEVRKDLPFYSELHIRNKFDSSIQILSTPIGQCHLPENDYFFIRSSEFPIDSVHFGTAGNHVSSGRGRWKEDMEAVLCARRDSAPKVDCKDAWMRTSSLRKRRTANYGTLDSHLGNCCWFFHRRTMHPLRTSVPGINLADR